MAKRKGADASGKPDRPAKRARKAPPAHAAAISSYHATEKQASQLAGNPVALFRLRQQQDSLAAYQDASLQGASTHGETSKWLAKALRKLRPEGSVRLLDVGAIDGQAYAAYDWIEATSIDLEPRADAVLKADFFAYPTPPSDDEAFDVVALSLVLNFVGDLEQRGEMLRLAAEHLAADGMLYLVLPLACVANSRFLDHDRLRAVLGAAGFDVVRQHDSAKLTYWLARRRVEPSRVKHFGKRPLPGRAGGERNNFAIVLQ